MLLPSHLARRGLGGETPVRAVFYSHKKFQKLGTRFAESAGGDILSIIRENKMDLIGQANDFMKWLNVRYAFCGGHAIDIMIGHKTRPHKDLDFAVFWDDRDLIVSAMLEAGWNVLEPCGGGLLHKISSVQDQRRMKSNIWCVHPANPHYRLTETEWEKDVYTSAFDGSEQMELDFMEFLFNTEQDGFFLYSRNNDVKREMSHAVLKKDGIPCLASEVILLYKSNALDQPGYREDFDHALPLLSGESRQWLKDAIGQLYPSGHEWYGVL